MPGSDWTTAGLWLAVIASGLYHGLNPGMGWPLAVAAGLMEKSARALLWALVLLAAGHLAAMAIAILPFAVLGSLSAWLAPLRIAASVLLLMWGLLLLLRPRHPRVLARIPPTRLALWSFVAATAHGAGLMLVPVYLGLCSAGGGRIEPADAALSSVDVVMAAAVATAHTGVMIVSGGVAAVLVYRVLGLAFLSRVWLNLDRVWAASLMLVGAVSLALVAR